MSALETILKYKIVAILRGLQPADTINVVAALHEGGINLVEITLNSSRALETISNLKATFGNKMLIGAGTVLNETEAKQAIDCGAAFLISPIIDAGVINIAKQNNVVSIPGAFTPTEIFTAHKCGADIIKVFPAANPDYIKNILAPLNFLQLMPTGSVNLENIKQYSDSGAAAFGIGSALVNTKAIIDDNYLNALTKKAAQFVAAVK